ncbi:MAG: pitrilysin family protein [Burkholderiales bacterium]
MTPAPVPARAAADADTTLVTLRNGVRVVVFALPYLATAEVSVFVRSGSQHESARQNGVSHFIEHMAFKGTQARTCQAINFDAERLGAEVDAHTDKDHTAFHMRGLARDAVAFVTMLGDIVRRGSFPADELERERQVILNEFAEDDDDPLATAFRLFDVACYGAHPAARPVIGNVANLRRFRREELVEFVQQQYTGANTIVAAAGNVDPRAIVAAAEAAFGDMPPGQENRIAAPDFVGGLRTRKLAGSSQAHVVLGFPVPSLAQAHEPFVVAAALLGEGMSSPLLDQLRERRGLVYHADCSADVRDTYGQFVIEASTMSGDLETYFAEVTRLLHEHAAATDAVGLARARNQIAVRTVRDHENAERRLELAALDLFALGRIRTRDERLAAIAGVEGGAVRDAFQCMLRGAGAVALAGKFAPAAAERMAKPLTRPEPGAHA